MCATADVVGGGGGVLGGGGGAFVDISPGESGLSPNPKKKLFRKKIYTTHHHHKKVRVGVGMGSFVADFWSDFPFFLGWPGLAKAESGRTGLSSGISARP